MAPRAAEGRALGRAQRGKFGRAQPRFQRERMMHQRDQSMARAQRLGGIGQHSESKAIDHDGMPMGKRR
jgi:hypothetical protein